MWFSKLRRLAGEQEPAEGQLPKFDSVVYDFAPPGHGKGCVSFLVCFSVCWFDNAHGQQHAATHPVASDSI